MSDLTQVEIPIETFADFYEGFNQPSRKDLYKILELNMIGSSDLSENNRRFIRALYLPFDQAQEEFDEMDFDDCEQFRKTISHAVPNIEFISFLYWLLRGKNTLSIFSGNCVIEMILQLLGCNIVSTDIVNPKLHEHTRAIIYSFAHVLRSTNPNIDFDTRARVKFKGCDAGLAIDKSAEFFDGDLDFVLMCCAQRDEACDRAFSKLLQKVDETKKSIYMILIGDYSTHPIHGTPEFYESLTQLIESRKIVKVDHYGWREFPVHFPNEYCSSDVYRIDP